MGPRGPDMLPDAWAAALRRNLGEALVIDGGTVEDEGDHTMQEEGGEDGDLDMGGGVANMIPKTPPGLGAPAPGTPAPAAAPPGPETPTPEKGPPRQRRRRAPEQQAEEDDPDKELDNQLAKAGTEDAAQALVASRAFQSAFQKMLNGALAQALAQPTFMEQLAVVMGGAAANINARIAETEQRLTDKTEHTEKKLSERAAALEKDMRDLRLTTERLQQQLREGVGSAGSAASCSSAAASPRFGAMRPNLAHFVMQNTGTGTYDARGVRTDALIVTGFPPWSTAARIEGLTREFLEQLPAVSRLTTNVKSTGRVGTRCWLEFPSEQVAREALQIYYKALDQHRGQKTDFKAVGGSP